MNNPLKYTDPSGYVFRYSDIEEREKWAESMRWWYESQQILLDAYYKSYGNGGGGGYRKPSHVNINPKLPTISIENSPVF